jgi:hypothetical protein
VAPSGVVPGRVAVIRPDQGPVCASRWTGQKRAHSGTSASRHTYPSYARNITVPFHAVVTAMRQPSAPDDGAACVIVRTLQCGSGRPIATCPWQPKGSGHRPAPAKRRPPPVRPGGTCTAKEAMAAVRQLRAVPRPNGRASRSTSSPLGAGPRRRRRCRGEAA